MGDFHSLYYRKVWHLVVDNRRVDVPHEGAFCYR